MWKWDWRRAPRGREEGELNDLFSLLQVWRPKANTPDKPKCWIGKDGEFSTEGLKTLIEDQIAAAGGVEPETVWSNLIPKKVVILAWRVKLGRVLCREALDKMGIELHSTLCTRCSKEVEMIDRTILRCEEVSSVWRSMARWWNRNLENIDSVENLLASCEGSGGNSNQPTLWKETVWAVIYLIWAQRNQMVFETDRRKLEDLVFEFQRKTYEWIANRVRKKKLVWNLWLSNPLISLQNSTDG